MSQQSSPEERCLFAFMLTVGLAAFLLVGMFCFAGGPAMFVPDEWQDIVGISSTVIMAVMIVSLIGITAYREHRRRNPKPSLFDLEFDGVPKPIETLDQWMDRKVGGDWGIIFIMPFMVALLGGLPIMMMCIEKTWDWEHRLVNGYSISGGKYSARIVTGRTILHSEYGRGAKTPLERAVEWAKNQPRRTK
jgi:hypothetical protein